jgi:hypothetical protein
MERETKSKKVTLAGGVAQMITHYPQRVCIRFQWKEIAGLNPAPAGQGLMFFGIRFRLKSDTSLDVYCF